MHSEVVCRGRKCNVLNAEMNAFWLLLLATLHHRTCYVVTLVEVCALPVLYTVHASVNE